MKEISEQIRAAGLSASQVDTLEPEALPGGEGDGKADETFDEGLLAKGIAVEKEHTDDEQVAKEIAKDHLSEDPAYYDKLDEMEKAGVDKATFCRFAAKPKLPRYSIIVKDKSSGAVQDLGETENWKDYLPRSTSSSDLPMIGKKKSFVETLSDGSSLEYQVERIS
jgi:hypothetical protein